MRCAFAAVAALAVLSMPAFADVRVVVSKSRQQMAVSIDGGSSYRWAVSTGRSGYTTPSGTFRAIRLERVYYSKKYDNAPMPHAVFFHGGYAIHGTMEERHLGRAVSHGCVRLSRAHAAILFAAVREAGMNHTHVVITDAPLYGGVPVARRIEAPAGAPRDREARRRAPDDGPDVVAAVPRDRERLAVIPGYATFDDVPRGFYDVEGPVRGEPRVVVVPVPGYADRPPPGYAVSRPLTRRERRELAREEARRAAELRRFYRDNGFEW
jgi:hypothetical protein